MLNDTRVVPARMELTKTTGGKVRILFLVNEKQSDLLIKGLPDRKLKIGDLLSINSHNIVEVVSQDNEEFTLKILISSEEFQDLMRTVGITPLPPYIHTTLTEAEARAKYQTVFAGGKLGQDSSSAKMPSLSNMSLASVAAPTASLHFTPQVFRALEAKHIEKAFVTLHVGRGTFSSVDSSKLENRGRGAETLHEEPIFVPKTSADMIATAKKEGRPIIASGTTATRVLESTAEYISNSLDKVDAARDSAGDFGDDFVGNTSIFIKPPYDFKIVDGLITNFHLPNTSLLVLLDAFIQYKYRQNKKDGALAAEQQKTWRDLYEYAIKNQFRFYSFGDAMLVI